MASIWKCFFPNERLRWLVYEIQHLPIYKQGRHLVRDLQYTFKLISYYTFKCNKILPQFNKRIFPYITPNLTQIVINAHFHNILFSCFLWNLFSCTDHIMRLKIVHIMKQLVYRYVTGHFKTAIWCKLALKLFFFYHWMVTGYS